MIKKIARINKKLPLKKETQIMRLRNVPGSREAIADSPLAINEPKELKGNGTKNLEITTLLELKSEWEKASL